jgi:hypothetical protein
VVYSTPKGEGGISSDTALLLFAIALRHPRIGGVVWKSKNEFLDEMLLATGLSKEKASAALVEANKCGLLQFVRIQGEGHWQMQLTWPPTAASQSQVAVRWEAATPPAIYKVRDLSAEAILAAVEENSGGTDTDSGGDGAGKILANPHKPNLYSPGYRQDWDGLEVTLVEWTLLWVFIDKSEEPFSLRWCCWVLRGLTGEDLWNDEATIKRYEGIWDKAKKDALWDRMIVLDTTMLP